jgi:hypothetical protein
VIDWSISASLVLFLVTLILHVTVKATLDSVTLLLPQKCPLCTGLSLGDGDQRNSMPVPPLNVGYLKKKNLLSPLSVDCTYPIIAIK